jgi:hypothetical protein
MIRKSLFWGLTLILVVALVGLIIQGRRLEKQDSGSPVEIVQESVPTATRVLIPPDLEVLHSKMTLDRSAEKTDESDTAHHEIEIQNRGDVAYKGIQLSFDYLNRSGKVLATKTYLVSERIPPGNTLKLDDIRIGKVPVSATDFRVAVNFADIARVPVSP